jgi:DNA-binding CsgD family transcriptional regulator
MAATFPSQMMMMMKMTTINHLLPNKKPEDFRLEVFFFALNSADFGRNQPSYVLANTYYLPFLYRSPPFAYAGRGTYSSEEVQSILEKEDAVSNGALDNYNLTEHEIEIIILIAEGYSNKQIGEKLFISHRTVDPHRTNLMNKLNVYNVASIVKFSMTHGMLD